LAVILRANPDSVPPKYSARAADASLAELGGRPRGGVLGKRNTRLLVDLAGFHRLEDHVERHHLGERGGIARRVGIGGMQRLAGIGVDNDRRVFRRMRRRQGEPRQNDQCC
jgi:hypothetical protein